MRDQRASPRLTSSVGDVAAEEPPALLAVHQGGTLEQQGRREDVAGDGGEDVDGGTHGWLERWGRCRTAGWTDGPRDRRLLFKVLLELGLVIRV